MITCAAVSFERSIVPLFVVVRVRVMYDTVLWWMAACVCVRCVGGNGRMEGSMDRAVQGLH